MSWLSILLFVATHITDIIGLVNAIIDLIKKLPRSDKEIARFELSQAIKSQNPNEVKEVVNKWHKKCEGVGCAMDLVGEETA